MNNLDRIIDEMRATEAQLHKEQLGVPQAPPDVKPDFSLLRPYQDFSYTAREIKVKRNPPEQNPITGGVEEVLEMARKSHEEKVNQPMLMTVQVLKPSEADVAVLKEIKANLRKLMAEKDAAEMKQIANEYWRGAMPGCSVVSGDKVDRVEQLIQHKRQLTEHWEKVLTDMLPEELKGTGCRVVIQGPPPQFEPVNGPFYPLPVIHSDFEYAIAKRTVIHSDFEYAIAKRTEEIQKVMLERLCKEMGVPPRVFRGRSDVVKMDVVTIDEKDTLTPEEQKSIREQFEDFRNGVTRRLTLNGRLSQPIPNTPQEEEDKTSPHEVAERVASRIVELTPGPEWGERSVVRKEKVEEEPKKVNFREFL